VSDTCARRTVWRRVSLDRRCGYPLIQRHHSVTLLINGGEVSRKDIQLSLENGRRVIVLSRTGRLADELARQPERHNLMIVIPVNAEKSIAEAIQAILSVTEAVSVSPLTMDEQFTRAT
jgi:hypothetical protein